MKKGERTRQMLLERSAALFNSRGYAGVSMSDIMAATGLEKGGIYNHFRSKDELAEAAFNHYAQLLERRLEQALADKVHTPDRFEAIVGVYRELATAPPFPGGCPVLNAAVEADDGDPALRGRAQKAMNSLMKHISVTVRVGVARREVWGDVDPERVASVFFSTLEGALVLSKLYGDPVYMDRAAQHLRTYVKSISRQ